jgi:hypothetical protein
MAEGFNTSEMDEAKPVNIDTKVDTLCQKDPVGVAQAEEALSKLNEQGGELGLKLKTASKIVLKPPQVEQAFKYRNQAVNNFAANSDTILADTLTMYEAEANNHTDYRFAVTLREQIAANTDAAGKVDAKGVEAFVKELVAKRDARRAEAAQNVAAKRAVSAKAKEDIAVAQRFDSLIQKYYDSGFDPSVLANGLADFLPKR